MKFHKYLFIFFLITSGYIYAGGFYIDFKYEGKDGEHFILTPIDRNELVYMPKDLIDCDQLRISFDYSFKYYFNALIGTAKYPNVLVHNGNISALENTPLMTNVRFSFIGGYPFEYSGCDLKSSSLIVTSPNAYLPIEEGVP